MAKVQIDNIAPGADRNAFDGAVGEALARWARGTSLPILPQYLGQVATRSVIPNNIATGFRSGNGQTFHVAQEDISELQVAYANWRHRNDAPYEEGSGGTLTVSASIQYPIAATPATGNWQTFTWSGAANTGAIANGVTSALSDALELATPIPRGAAFLLRWHAEATVQIPFFQYTASNSAAINQIAEASATPAAFSDKTTGGAIASGTSANNLYPVLIVGQTRRPSFYAFGDSRVQGVGDTFDATGNLGELCRGIGEHFAYLNLGCPSAKLYQWLPNSTRRQALMPYFSHMVGNWSINDIADSRTVAQLSADITAAAALGKTWLAPSGRKVLWATMCPSSGLSSGTEYDVADGSTQTVSGNNSLRTGVNDLLRARMVPDVDAVLDIAAAMENGINSGKWEVEGGGTGGSTGKALTNDGLHANWRGYQRIKQRVVAMLLALALP
jgi:hypothetical protein